MLQPRRRLSFSSSSLSSLPSLRSLPSRLIIASWIRLLGACCREGVFISRFKKSFQLARVSSKSLLTQLLEKPRNTRVRRRRGEKRLEERGERIDFVGGVRCFGVPLLAHISACHNFIPFPQLGFPASFNGMWVNSSEGELAKRFGIHDIKKETNDEFAHWWSARKTQFSCCFNVPLKGTL